MARSRLGGDFVQKMLGQQRDVRGAFPQRRKVHLHASEAVIEVGAKRALPGIGAQIPTG